MERKVVPKSTHESRDTKVDANPYESPDKEVVRRCDGRVEMVAGCRLCTKCGRGAEIAKTCARILDRTVETEPDKTLKRNAESLQIANNVWFFRTEAEPVHPSLDQKKAPLSEERRRCCRPPYQESRRQVPGGCDVLGGISRSFTRAGLPRVR